MVELIDEGVNALPNGRGASFFLVESGQLSHFSIMNETVYKIVIWISLPSILVMYSRYEWVD